MSLIINTNTFSQKAQRNLGANYDRLSKSVERLSSGLRINSAADDAAGLAISESLRADIRSLNQAVRNTNDGISMLKTGEGALSEVNTILIRMRELASQAATGSVGSAERATINREFTSLRSEIDRISATAEFKGQGLLDGSLANASGVSSVVIQVGLNATTNDRININSAVDLTAITGASLGLSSLSVTSAANALSALGQLDSALSVVSDGRGRLGAVQNRLEHTIANLNVSVENLTAAESQIRDADYAAEISDFTKNQILFQSSTAILAQANLVPQSVLQLLG